MSGPGPAGLGAVHAKLVVATLAWGGTFIAGRVLARSMPHLWAATGRYLVATACLLVLARGLQDGLPRLDRRQLAGTALLGLTGMFLYNVFFLGALGRLPASRTALIVALNPALTALLVAAVYRERLSALRWLGIAVAFLGVVLVLSRGRPAALLSGGVGVGELMMMGAALSWAIYTVIGRALLRDLSPLAATTWASLWATLFLGLGAAAQWREFSLSQLGASNLLAMAYLGAVGTAMAFLWYLQAVRAIGPSRTAVFNNLVPVFGMLLGVLLLHEPLHWSMVAGGFVALAGVTLVNLPGGR